MRRLAFALALTNAAVFPAAASAAPATPATLRLGVAHFESSPPEARKGPMDGISLNRPKVQTTVYSEEDRIIVIAED